MVARAPNTGVWLTESLAGSAQGSQRDLPMFGPRQTVHLLGRPTPVGVSGEAIPVHWRGRFRRRERATVGSGVGVIGWLFS